MTTGTGIIEQTIRQTNVTNNKKEKLCFAEQFPLEGPSFTSSQHSTCNISKLGGYWETQRFKTRSGLRNLPYTGL